MKTISEIFTKHIKAHKKVYALSLVFMALGIVCGSVCAVFANYKADGIADDINSFFSAYILQGADNITVFWYALWENIRFVALVFASTFFVITVPVVFAWVGVKGFKLGFSFAFFIKIYSFKGILFSICSVLIQNIIFLPVLLCYCAVSIDFAVKFRKTKKGNTGQFDMKKLYINKILFFLLFCFLSAVCAAVQAFVIPAFIKPVCSLFL